jgi:hypothetical protein
MHLAQTLNLPRCPHCSVDTPNLSIVAVAFETLNGEGRNKRYWNNYKCQRCGGVVVACSQHPHPNNLVTEFYPGVTTVSEDLPQRVRLLLKEATESVFTPNGSIMTCASAVDEMLKQKNYRSGSLYSRIDQAKIDGLLTADMAAWAHKVRLDANERRHTDDNAPLATTDDAKQAVEFTKTLADLLFVLPAKVARNMAVIESATQPPITT